MKYNEFDNTDKDRLYRNVKDLLHPSISKRNISNYKIIINDNLLPLRVFYPIKVSNIENVMIYIHGESNITNCNNNYSKVSERLSKKYNNLVLSIDYDNYINNKNVNKLIYNTIIYIYKELNKINIKNITLVGDSTAATKILYLSNELYHNNIKFNKYLLFYPPITGNYNIYENTLYKRLNKYYKNMTNIFPITYNNINSNTLIICGDIDPLLKEDKEFCNKYNIKLETIPNAYHGFLNSRDDKVINTYTNIINKFLNE